MQLQKLKVLKLKIIWIKMRTIETILYKFEELSEEANNEDYEFTEDGTLN